MSTLCIGSPTEDPPPPAFTPGQLVRAITAPLLGASCFIFGAFVLEDPGYIVFSTLRKQGGYRRWTFQYLPTHDVFQVPHMHEEYAIGPPTDEYGHLIKELRDQWEVPIAPTSLCTSQCPFKNHDECSAITEAVKKRIILTYPFEVKNTITGQKMQYCYVKLEDRPYYSPFHVTSAIKRYTFGKANESNFFVSRREDDMRINSVIDENDKELPDPWKFSPQKAFYDANVRAANEMFVPRTVFAGVLGLAVSPERTVAVTRG